MAYGKRIAWCLLALAATAQAEDTGAEGQYFGEFPVVLSASRLVQPVTEAPAAVTVIDRDTIKASGARQIAEVFRLVPGFLVTYRNGHAPAVAYHGLADTYARRLQVMIDGLSVYSPLFGGVDWNDLPISIEDIERIEIVRGPNGASFGANAFVGMVNIITREPAAGSASDASLNAGSNGVGDLSVRHAGGTGPWRFSVAAGQRSDDGFDDFSDSSQVEYARLRAHYQLDARNELMATVSHAGGVGDEHYEIIRPRTFEAEDLQLRWTQARADNELWLQFHHSRRKAREEFVVDYVADLRPFGGPRVEFPVPVSFNNDVQRDEVEFQQSLSALGPWRLVWGGQWRQDAVRSQGLFNRQDWLTNRLGRLFASVEWRPLRQLLLHGGATYEHTSLTGGSVSPRLSATAFLADGHSLRAGISRARRTPTLYEEFTNQSYPVPPELHGALVGLAPRLPPPWNTTVLSPILAQTYKTSGGLEDETILARELAYLGRLPALGLSGEVRWFSEHARNLMYLHRIPFPTALNPSDTAGDIRNQDYANIRGVEGSLRWTPRAGTDVTVSGARTIIVSSNVDADYAPTAPVHAVSALLRQELPWESSASVAFYRVGSTTWLSGGDPLPAFERVDLRLAKRFRWGQQRMEVAWVLQNALDEPYLENEDRLRSKRVSWLRVQSTF